MFNKQRYKKKKNKSGQCQYNERKKHTHNQITMTATNLTVVHAYRTNMTVQNTVFLHSSVCPCVCVSNRLI